MYVHQKYPRHKPTTKYISNKTKLFSPQMTIVSYPLYLRGNREKIPIVFHISIKLYQLRLNYLPLDSSLPLKT